MVEGLGQCYTRKRSLEHNLPEIRDIDCIGDKMSQKHGERQRCREASGTLIESWTLHGMTKDFSICIFFRMQLAPLFLFHFLKFILRRIYLTFIFLQTVRQTTNIDILITMNLRPLLAEIPNICLACGNESHQCNKFLNKFSSVKSVRQIILSCTVKSYAKWTCQICKRDDVNVPNLL